MIANQCRKKTQDDLDGREITASNPKTEDS
jgi:hypothetical protein